MTASRVDKLRALIEAMTARPWVDNGNGMIVAPEDDGDAMLVDGYVCDTPRTMSADARGIVALRNCADELLAVVEAAERRRFAEVALRAVIVKRVDDASRAHAVNAVIHASLTVAIEAAEEELRAAIRAENAALDALAARIAALPDGGDHG